MSLCDVCHAPGLCCRRIFLSTVKEDGAREPLTIWSDEDPTEQIRERGYPFVAVEKWSEWTDPDGRAYSAWVWGCPNLNPVTGRCDDYANRPQVCRDFEPRQNELCALFDGFTGGDASAWSVPPES